MPVTSTTQIEQAMKALAERMRSHIPNAGNANAEVFWRNSARILELGVEAILDLKTSVRMMMGQTMECARKRGTGDYDKSQMQVTVVVENVTDASGQPAIRMSFHDEPDHERCHAYTMPPEMAQDVNQYLATILQMSQSGGGGAPPDSDPTPTVPQSGTVH